jgi:hypothetical protein
MRFSMVGSIVVVLSLVVSQASAVTNVYDLKPGAVELKSAGPLAFSPDGVLFVGDPTAATVFALSTDDAKGDVKKANVNVAEFDKKLGEALGVAADKLQIRDLAVNPVSGNVYLSVTVTEPQQAALAKVDASGKISKLS